MSPHELVLISIPHTGTSFTAGLFQDCGFRVAGLFERPGGKTLYHGHMVKAGQTERALELASRMPLVVPLRHPYLVEEAWKRRGKSIGELIDCYRTLAERFMLLEPYIMPVDSDRREEALRVMNDGLDLRLETDWRVVNGKHQTHALRREHLSPSYPIKRLVEEIQPFLDRWY